MPLDTNMPCAPPPAGGELVAVFFQIFFICHQKCYCHVFYFQIFLFFKILLNYVRWIVNLCKFEMQVNVSE